MRTGVAGTCGPRSRWDNRRPVTSRPSDLRRQTGPAKRCSARPLIMDANALHTRDSVSGIIRRLTSLSEMGSTRPQRNIPK